MDHLILLLYELFEKPRGDIEAMRSKFLTEGGTEKVDLINLYIRNNFENIPATKPISSAAEEKPRQLNL